MARRKNARAARAVQTRFAGGSFNRFTVKAKITVTPKKAVLDPQGKTVQNALEHMGYKGIKAVHVGKYLEIDLADGDKATYEKQINEACHKLLSNPVIEDYHFTIE
jgi:phosphoribosylformylglycinamidine synthase PurS subunit